MRLTSVLSYSLPPLLLLIAACSDGSGGDAKFSTATDAQRQRAISAAGGLDAGMAFLLGSFVGVADPAGACPTIVTAGDRVTATFDCTDDEGNRIDGRIVTTNVGPIFGPGPMIDPTKAAVVELDGYHFQDADEPGEDFAFDGTVSLRPDQSFVIALTAELEGLTVTTDATLRNADERSSAAGGSTIDLEGVGSAVIGGSWNLSSDTPAGALELQGAELLRVDFDAMADGCAPITIDGNAAGEVCGDAE